MLSVQCNETKASVFFIIGVVDFFKQGGDFAGGVKGSLPEHLHQFSSVEPQAVRLNAAVNQDGFWILADGDFLHGFLADGAGAGVFDASGGNK